MTEFRFQAIGAGGEVQRGVMQAASEAEVITRLQRQGSVPMRAEPVRGGAFFTNLLHAEFVTGPSLRQQDVANLTTELATMLGAGQDLDRALRYLQETAPNRRVHRAITTLRDLVRDGSPLAAALAQQPRNFSPLYIGIVRAGEAGGKLADTLARLAELQERQRRLAATVSSAMIYPGLLLLTAIGAVTLLLTKVLPEFVPLFDQAGAHLPPSTQFLMDAGNVIASDGVFMVILLAALVLLSRAALRQPRVRVITDRLLLRLPVIGAMFKEIVAARFTRTLGTLLVNGVPLIAALSVVRDALGNLAAVAAIDRASVSARGGLGLVTPLTDSGVFPLRTTHLLRLGEENAQLGTMALHAADIHEEHTRIAVQRLVSLLVPAITILMGAVVAGIVGSLLTAMLSLNDLAGAG